MEPNILANAQNEKMHSATNGIESRPSRRSQYGGNEATTTGMPADVPMGASPIVAVAARQKRQCKMIRTYDKNSNQTSAETREPDETLRGRTEASFDELNRAYETRRWIAGDPGLAANYVVTKQLFDASSLLDTVTDDNQHTVHMIHDRANRLTESTDHLGNKNTLVFDSNSNLVRTISTELHPDVPAGQTFTKERTYDELNQFRSAASTARDPGRYWPITNQAVPLY